MGMDLVSILECVSAGLVSDEDLTELLLDAISRAGREPCVLGRPPNEEGPERPPRGKHRVVEFWMSGASTGRTGTVCVSDV
jgi:hypothetical protein